MDIRKFSVSESGTVQIKDAAGELIPGVEIDVWSPGSKEFARAQARNQGRIMARLRKKSAEVSADQKIAEEAEYLADITKEFRGVDYDKLTGRDLHLAVYKDKTLGFIADQVAAFVGDWANFTPGSKQS